MAALLQGSGSILRPISYHGEPVGAVYLESDMSGLIARLTRYAAIAGPVFVLSLLLAFVLSVRLQRVVSEPIRHLAGVACSVAVEKNYGLRASKQSNDELGQLVDGFNAMLAQIQERDAALQAARHSLEMRVQERTAELAAANQSLLVEIEERKRTEEQLRVQATALDAAANTIVITDPNRHDPIGQPRLRRADRLHRAGSPGQEPAPAEKRQTG